MKLKRVVILLAICMVVMIAPAAMADTISSGDYVKLTAYNSLDGAGIMTYAVSHNAGGTTAFSYDTFCIQDNVFITPNTWYPVAAISNTVGYFNTGIAGGGPLNGAVDYLFYKYKSGAYASFDVNNQNDFQRLLWSLQGVRSIVFPNRRNAMGD